MSTLVMGLVWPLALPPTEKAVLVSLADNANDQGMCWPAIEPREGKAKRGTSITERTCFKARAVQGALSSLEARGLIDRTFQRGRSTIYRINLERLAQGDLLEPTPAADAPPRHAHPRTMRTPAADAPVQVVRERGAADAPWGAPGAPASAADAPQPSRTSKNRQGTVSGRGADAASPEPEQVFEWIPLNDGTKHPVTHARILELKRLYPAVDVEQEVRKVVGWNLAHPRNRKTRKGIEAHLTAWMAREQDRAPIQRAEAMPRSDADWLAWGERAGIHARAGESTQAYVARLRDAREAAA